MGLQNGAAMVLRSAMAQWKKKRVFSQCVLVLVACLCLCCHVANACSMYKFMLTVCIQGAKWVVISIIFVTVPASKGRRLHDLCSCGITCLQVLSHVYCMSIALLGVWDTWWYGKLYLGMVNDWRYPVWSLSQCGMLVTWTQNAWGGMVYERCVNILCVCDVWVLVGTHMHSVPMSCACMVYCVHVRCVRTVCMHAGSEPDSQGGTPVSF